MKSDIINGIDVLKLEEFSKAVAEDKKQGITQFKVHTEWLEGTKSVTKVQEWKLGNQSYSRDFSILIDEPKELLGENLAANPQEVLMAALNACMTVGYVVQAAVENIKLTKLEIVTEGKIDLRGFLGINPDTISGYEEIHCKVKINSNGTKEQVRQIHERVTQTSPNYWNIMNAVKIYTDLNME